MKGDRQLPASVWTQRTGFPRQLAAFFVILACMPSQLAMPAARVTFQHDVMAVLSKAGCNSGACHGNQHGKGGFRLSLRGQDPDQDYFALVRDLAGRRVDRISPQQSLILLKPTAQIPHQGGRRFGLESTLYTILSQWVRDGAPRASAEAPELVRIEVQPEEKILVAPEHDVQLRVAAVFSGGQRRDVTSLAVYEASNLLATVTPQGRVEGKAEGETTILVRYLNKQLPVRLAFVPARPDFQWNAPPVNNYVDRLVDERLRALRINASSAADDRVFVRRAYLDTLGLLPTSAEAQGFVNDPRPDKRMRLIDSLLARPELADHWALKWSDLLRSEEKVLDPRGVDLFYAWIRQSFAQGLPLDQFVRRLIAARGHTYKNPPANYYRANRDAMTRAETTARLFLGVRLQCAKCHNHPFDRWTQDEYYQWAALFARIGYDILENKRKDKLDKNEFQGQQIVLVSSSGEVRNPRTGHDAQPRFLADVRQACPSEDDRLQRLADWLTSRQNRAFARAQVNRIMYHVFGTAPVDPVDDFRSTNPESIPGLLDALADDFIAHDFNVRHIIRILMQSRTYQLSSEPNETNRDDQRTYSRAIVRRLTAEQLLDAQSQVLGVPAKLNGYPLGMRAGQMPGVQRVRFRDKPPEDGDRFLIAFGKPRRFLPSECERSNETTLAQTLMLTSGEAVHRRLTHPDNRLSRLVASGQQSCEILDELYWSALSRPPTAAERDVALRLLEPPAHRADALQDIAWALVNSKEFIFRR